MVDNWNDLKQGETISSEIDYISNSGNGMVILEDREVNIGPVTKDSVDEEISIQKVSIDFAICLVPEFRKNSYFENYPGSDSDFYYNTNTKENPKYKMFVSGHRHPQPGETFAAKIDRIGHSEKGIIATSSGHDVIVSDINEDDVGELIEAEMIETRTAKKISSDINIDKYWLVEEEKSADDTCDVPSPQAVQEDVSSSNEQVVDSKNENAVDFHSMEEGDMFSAEVSRLSSSGNGIIDTVNGHVNLGPVLDNVVGETIQARFLGGFYAIPVSEDMRGEEVDEWLSNSQIDLSDIDSELIPVSVDTNAEISDSNTSTDEVQVQRETATWGNGFENGSRTDTESRSIEGHKSDRSVQTGLEELRQKAEEDSVEEIPADTTTYTSSKQEYTRSPAIREYVKARADGVCEACDSPAPFENRDGDPYLHAHHIHELSDGGSDTINSVAAVCPNCHYRIHHGRDGDEYNQELLETIKAIENEE